MFRQRSTTLPVIFHIDAADFQLYAQVFTHSRERSLWSLFSFQSVTCQGFRFKAYRFHLQNVEAYVGRNPSTRLISAFFVSSVMVVVDGKPVRLQLCDMAGQVSCTPHCHSLNMIINSPTRFKSNHSAKLLFASSRFSSCLVLIEMGAGWWINQCKSSGINKYLSVISVTPKPAVLAVFVLVAPCSLLLVLG